LHCPRSEAKIRYMTPIQRYQQDLDDSLIQPDAAQRQAVEQLDEIYSQLTIPSKPENSFFKGLFKKKQSTPPVRGLYMWGGVGRGKTYLMDLFFDSLPFENKKRVHFHRFMQSIQDELKDMRDLQNPLQIIAQTSAKNIRVLCLDEFQVHDIADAMILAGLLQALFNNGVSLITTSNTKPDLLYKDGLQRDRFLPAIDLLNTHTTVMNVDGGNDYRLRALNQAQTWLSPPDEKSNAKLRQYFEQLSTTASTTEDLIIFQRPIPVILRSEGIAWFEFNALCDGPRGQADYIELSRIFHTVQISNIPSMTWEQDDKARRFIELIDEFYDRHVNLIASAQASPGQLYQGERLSAMFERTSSRLLEMQSVEYMALEHKA